MTCIKKVKDFRHERLLFGGTLGNQKAASGERQQARHSSRPPAMSASDSQCQLPGSRFELLEFRFVVDCGSGPIVDSHECPVPEI